MHVIPPPKPPIVGRFSVEGGPTYQESGRVQNPDARIVTVPPDSTAELSMEWWSGHDSFSNKARWDSLKTAFRIDTIGVEIGTIVVGADTLRWSGTFVASDE